MAKSALDEYLELVAHESHSISSYLNDLKEGYKAGKKIPEVRELIEKTEREFKKRAEFLTNAEIKALSAKLTHETELQIRRIANEKPEEEKKKEESGSGAGPIKRKMQGEIPDERTSVEGTIQTKENTPTKNPKSTIVRGGFGQTGERATSGGQIKLAGSSRKGPVTADERAASRLSGMTYEARRGGSIGRSMSAPDTAANSAKRLKKIQKELNRNNKPFAKAALGELQKAGKEQASIQAAITADLIAKGIISGEKPLTNDEIAKFATKQGQEEVQRIAQTHKEIQDALTKEQAGKKLEGLRRDIAIASPEEREIYAEGYLDEPLDRGAAITGNPNAEPPMIRVGGKSVPIQNQNQNQNDDDDEDNNDDQDDNRRRRIPRKRKKKKPKVPDFIGNPLSGPSGLDMKMAQRAAFVLMRLGPVGWGILIAVIIIFIILAVFFIDEGAKEYAKNQSCTVTETLSVFKTGPTQAVNGQILNYVFTIKDTAPMQELTIVEKLPLGISLNPADIQSSWAKYTLDPVQKTITWKATENVPPGSLNATNITFTLTLKANAPSAHLLYVITSTPTRSGGGVGGTVIVLDPGHGGSNSSLIDPATGLMDTESANTPEREEVFEVAQKVKTDLEASGYRVILTKSAPLDTTSHRARADVANNANAMLAVSIHNDHGQPYSWSEVYTQKVGLYREYQGKRLAFTDAAIADKSAQYGQIMAAERALVEGRAVPLRDANFNARGASYSTGNIPLVMLFAKVPWVYNEIGAAPAGVRVPQDQIDKYAQGISNGIKKAVPVTAGSAPAPGCTPGGATGGGPVAFDDIPPSQDTCGGKYRLTSPLGNFGDPLCKFTKDDLATLIKDPTNGDPLRFNEWFNIIIPGESGHNPNAFNGNSTSGKGAYGLYQMNPKSAGYGLDNGSVIWSLQTRNAIGHNRNLIQRNCIFWYWEVARGAGIAQGPCRR